MICGGIMGYTDLHLHFDGSLPLETVKVLSWLDREADIELPYEDTDILKCLQYDADKDASEKTLKNYLKCFDLPLSLLQTEDNIRFAIREVAKDLKKRGVDYAEIRFAPQLHTRRGLSQMAVVESILQGYTDRLDFTDSDKKSISRLRLMEYENATGIDLGLNSRPEYPHIRFILCLMRGNMRDKKKYEMNMETVEVARHFMSEGNSLIAGIDLAGDEAGYPTEDYVDFFGVARKHRIPFTIHAGEARGAESIWQALRMGAKRIGHGIAAAKDEKLMQRLSESGTVLEMCPTSNLQTGAVSDISRYPLRLFLQYGIKVTINSDNMTVSGTDVGKEFEFLRKELMLSDEEERQLRKNAEEGHL